MKVKRTEDRKTQVYASLGIGFVCLIIGLPLWWKTTEVYRVQLPYQQIASLINKHVQYSVDITIVTYDYVDKTDLAIFGEDVKEALEGSGSESHPITKYRGNIRSAYEDERLSLKKVKSIQELDSRLEGSKLLHEHGKYSIVLLPKNTTLLSDNNILLGRHSAVFIKQTTDLNNLIGPIKKVVKDVLVNEDWMRKVYQASSRERHLKDDKESMRSVKNTPGYDVTFTLLNPEPETLNVQWDIERAVQVYLEPFLTKMKDFMNITVSSQVIHYTQLSVKSNQKQSGDSRHFYINPEGLPHMINPIEAKLGSPVSNYPRLNFVVYIPPRNKSPLLVYDDKEQPSTSNAFLSPRWGGILIYNVFVPLETNTLPLVVNLDMKTVMQVFLSQLHLLTGFNKPTHQNDVIETVPDNSGLSSWMFDSWLRAKVLENIATSTATLTSLAQLLEHISNIVITDDIGIEVEEATTNVEKAYAFLLQGELKNAYLASNQALVSSEKAFFDPSLLELLYFPEDQKYAIYIPLFLPISIPIVMSMIHSFKWIKSKTSKNNESTENEETENKKDK